MKGAERQKESGMSIDEDKRPRISVDIFAGRS